MKLALTFSKIQLMLLLSLVEIIVLIASVSSPYYYITSDVLLDEKSDLLWDYYYDKIRLQVRNEIGEFEEAVTIANCEWGDNTTGSTTDYTSMKNVFVNTFVMELIAIICTAALFIFIWLTIFPKCLCSVFGSKLNLIKLVLAGVICVLTVYASIYLPTALPGQIKKDNDDASIPDKICLHYPEWDDTPCNTLYGKHETEVNSEYTAVAQWGLERGAYLNWVAAIIAIALVLLAALTRNEAPKESSEAANAVQQLHLFVTCKCGMTLTTFSLIFSVILLCIGVIAMDMPFYYRSMTNKKSDPPYKNIYDYTQKMITTTMYTNYEEKNVATRISHAKWMTTPQTGAGYDQVLAGGNSSMQEPFETSWMLLIIANVFVFAVVITSAMTKWRKLECIFCAGHVFLVKMILSVVATLFFVLAWTLFSSNIVSAIDQGLPTGVICDPDNQRECNKQSGQYEQNDEVRKWGFEIGWVLCLLCSILMIPLMIMFIYIETHNPSKDQTQRAPRQNDDNPFKKGAVATPEV